MTIRSSDLLTIASSGLAAQNQLLKTTGNNIANVNTDGYVRERTTFVAQLTGGVGQGTTTRLIDLFAQNQLRRDTSTYAEHDAYYNAASQLDNIFASDSSSLSSSLNSFFDSLQTATDDPTNVAARQLVLGQGDALTGRFSALSTFLNSKEKDVNNQFEASTKTANDLIKNISDLNNQIRTTQYRNQHDVPGALMNERDAAISKLSELVDISTRSYDDGSTQVSLKSGESLVMRDGTFNIFSVSGAADINQKNLQLYNGSKQVTINLKNNDVGGKIGGLFAFRDEVLAPTQRKMGQIALTLADSINQRNHLGMDLDGQLGQDVFKLPEVAALNFNTNSSLALGVNGRLAAGQSSKLTTSDYQITIDAVNPGAPNTLDYTVNMVDANGNPMKDTSGNPITQSYTGVTAAAGSWAPVMDGLELEFPDGAGYAAGDKFILQPTKYTANQISVGITRSEDLAFASPIRLEADINNTGGAKLDSESVTNTVVDNTFADPNASAFDGSGGIQGPGAAPGGGVGAPAKIFFTAADSYEIRDSADNVITTVSGTSSLQNLIGQGKSTAGWPAAFSAQNDYPGYDISLQGVPKAGDSFTISYNTDGFDDNRNGLQMTELQSTDTVRRTANAPAGGTNGVSYHEAYAAIVSDVGQKTASAKVSQQAAKAMKDQSSSQFESVSGVNLDEEAANLMRFQQAYAASAKLITTSQSLFQTLLSAVR